MNRDEFLVEPEVSRESQRAAALRQIRWLLEFYRIEPHELTAPPPPPEADPAAAPDPAAPVKYRHPVSGETWNGLGPHPEWLRRALLQEGYRVAELRADLTEF